MNIRPFLVGERCHMRPYKGFRAKASHSSTSPTATKYRSAVDAIDLERSEAVLTWEIESWSAGITASPARPHGGIGMNHSRIGIMVLLLVCFIFFASMIAFATGTEATPVKPSGPGPYEVGFTNSTVYVDDVPGEEIGIDITVYYPATSSGMEAPPDPTDAPYPTILWYWWKDLNTTYQEMVFDIIASHGFVLVNTFQELHPNVDLPGPEPPGEWTIEDHNKAWVTTLDWVEALDADTSSVLHGMLDEEAYGIAGHGACTWAYLIGYDDGRYDAIAFLSGVWSDDYDWDITVPCHWQRAGYEPVWDPWPDFSIKGYWKATGEKCLVHVKDAHFWDGGYDIGMFVAFFLYYLDGKDEYSTFLYGGEAFMEVARGTIELWFDRGGDDVFPPKKDVVDVPNYAYYSPSKDTFLWKDLYSYGFVDSNNIGVNYPFLNGAHYPYTNIIFRIIPEGTNYNEQIITAEPIIDDCE